MFGTLFISQVRHGCVPEHPTGKLKIPKMHIFCEICTYLVRYSHVDLTTFPRGKAFEKWIKERMHTIERRNGR